MLDDHCHDKYVYHLLSDVVNPAGRLSTSSPGEGTGLKLNVSAGLNCTSSSRREIWH